MESKALVAGSSTVIRAAQHRILDEVVKKVIEQWLSEAHTPQRAIEEQLVTTESEQGTS